MMNSKTKTEYAVQMRHKCSKEWSECNCFGTDIKSAEEAKKESEYRNRAGRTSHYKFRAVKREVTDWEVVK
jgi:hypothetical protein